VVLARRHWTRTAGILMDGMSLQVVVGGCEGGVGIVGACASLHIGAGLWFAN